MGDTIPVRFGLSSPMPQCIDLQPIKLVCEPVLKVRRLGKFFFEPTALKWPIVIDNDPNFTISTNLKAELISILIPLYPFDGSEREVVWTAVDRHGVTASCITNVVFEDSLPPELTCPDLYVGEGKGLTAVMARFHFSTVPVPTFKNFRFQFQEAF